MAKSKKNSLIDSFKDSYDRTNKYYKKHLEAGYFYLVSVNSLRGLNEMSDSLKSIVPSAVDLINWDSIRIGLWEQSHLFLTANSSENKKKYRNYIPIFINMKENDKLTEVYWHYVPPTELNKFDFMEV
tara:strand:+ start:596 stop:979 length:384 start_codon:yes stop_codon:yes gene_type:complete